ncbi:MAG TPA: FHA domain-containing protein, partial [Planctomycetaceae bacterium]|nr:FHA domain-containing protein [Planctomycetaceae bacterium]
DLGSKNGTFVNEERIEGLQTVQTGDVIAFGPLAFEIVIDHTLGGVKRPKVRNIADVAERTQKDGMEDQDIAGWLEEGNVTQKIGDLDDTRTRLFKVESDVDEVDSDDTTIMTGSKPDETVAEENEEENEKKKSKKKEYGKLPPRTDQEATNSQDAATDAIKRYFNRS